MRWLVGVMVAGVIACAGKPPSAPAAFDLERTVAGVIDVVTNTDPVFTRDGAHVVFSSNRDGIPELYVGDPARPADPPRRLIPSTERMWSQVAVPDDDAIVFRSDRGADENWAYYRVRLDGTGLVALTPHITRHRDSPRIAAGRPDTIFYTARLAAEAGSGVYRTSAIAPGDERLIYREAQPSALVDVSPDGRRGLLWRFPAYGDNDLIAVDLETGATEAIYPRDGAKARIFGARWSGDGKRALIATDGGVEQARVVSIDVATGRETARYDPQPATAGIWQLYASGNTVMLWLDLGDHAELRALDATTLAPRRPITLPLGSGLTGAFSPNGARFALSWSTPNTPEDIYSVELASGQVSALRHDARPELAGLPPIDVSITRVEAFDHLALPVNLLLPADHHGRLPVVVDYHGGPASSAWLHWDPYARLLVSLGYAVVEPNIRGSTGFGRAFEAADDGTKRLDAFKDVETIARWTAAQPWADPRRMVASGGSYGGYLVLITLSRSPALWRAGIDEIGVSNLRTMLATTNGSMRALFRTEFGDLERDAAFLDSISPIYDADKIIAPLFVYAGAHDPRAPRAESDQIVRALRARHVPVEYMVADNEGHSMDHRETQLACYTRMARFLAHYVR